MLVKLPPPHRIGQLIPLAIITTVKTILPTTTIGTKRAAPAASSMSPQQDLNGAAAAVAILTTNNTSSTIPSATGGTPAGLLIPTHQLHPSPPSTSATSVGVLTGTTSTSVAAAAAAAAGASLFPGLIDPTIAKRQRLAASAFAATQAQAAQAQAVAAQVAAFQQAAALAQHHQQQQQQANYLNSAGMLGGVPVTQGALQQAFWAGKVAQMSQNNNSKFESKLSESTPHMVS